MTEISSIPTYFPKIAKRSEPCRTLFRSGASLRIVYRPSEADVIIRVTSWPSEDLMAVYDEHQVPIGNFLWLVWRAILFSTVKLRWSPNLKSNSKACSSTTKLVRAPLFWRKVLFITNNVSRFCFHSRRFQRFLSVTPLRSAMDFGRLVFAFLSIRSFHAVWSAPVSTCSLAAARRICVCPIFPQPPGIGRKISGASSTKAACCSSVSIRFP
jgi:hypothetical protein